MSKTKTYKGTREEWLEDSIKEVFKELKAKGFTDFVKKENEIKASFGHMPSGLKNSAIGVCQYTSEDVKESDYDKTGTRHLFIRPTLTANNLEETLDIFQVLAHEVCHAVLPIGSGHKKPFSDLIIKLLGAEGKPTATIRGAEFDKWAKPVVKKLGLVPHIAIVEQPKSAKTSIKIACLNAEECSGATDRSINQGYGNIFRQSSAVVYQQLADRLGETDYTLSDGEEIEGLFNCPCCMGETITICSGNFR